jgi:hypothetical protein
MKLPRVTIAESLANMARWPTQLRRILIRGRANCPLPE